MTMREKMARAIRTALDTINSTAADGCGIPPLYEHEALAAADAALSALAEPDEGMVRAALDAMKNGQSTHTNLLTAWSAMIDRVRKDGK